MDNGRSNRRSSSEWKVVVLLISIAVISYGVTATLSAAHVDNNNHPAIDTTAKDQQQQHRRLAAIGKVDDTTTPQQTSTVSLTSKFNEKRSFLDPSWKEWGDALVQFETLVSPAELDFTISRRLPWEQDESPEKCEEILLLMPEYFARNGHGSQLNSYVLAAMMATYLGKAMLILDAPQKNTKYPNGSMFGCPVDAFKDKKEFDQFTGNNHKHLEMKEDFPMGMSRLLQHSTLLSRGCAMPACSSFTYDSWEAIRKAQREHFLNGLPPREVNCEDGDRTQRVIPLGGEEVRQFFEAQVKPMILDETKRSEAYRWIIRLGANAHEAQVFIKLTKEADIWDFVSALMARSGIIKFQPWIARDVAQFIRQTDLPLNSGYDAIHVRRGDKLETESRQEVVAYWHSQGYDRVGQFPTNYIPFRHYLRLWDSTDCDSYWNGFQTQATTRLVYVATDDPTTVKEEIAKLPKGSDGTTIVAGCKKVKFIFAPVSEDSAFHINEGGGKVDCYVRYKRNIRAIADLMVLTKSDTFVGEFVSNWGRIIRLNRLVLNDSPLVGERKESSGKWLKKRSFDEDIEPPAFIRDFRVAFGDLISPPPGW
mmetsp:Transcript_17/g.53  ORF Transcript_17/g.53 Transcript_17/m.53 type:complete len:593 (-) Transcript_17:2396-4174(-)